MSKIASVIIRSNLLNGNTPIIVNGGQPRFLKHNVEESLDAAELHALRNSNTEFELCQTFENAAEDAAASDVADDATPAADGEASVGASPSTDPPAPEGASEVEPARDPLDHDGDGEKGGSLPGKKSTAAKGAAKKRAAKAKAKS